MPLFSTAPTIRFIAEMNTNSKSDKNNKSTELPQRFTSVPNVAPLSRRVPLPSLPPSRITIPCHASDTSSYSDATSSSTSTSRRRRRRKRHQRRRQEIAARLERRAKIEIGYALRFPNYDDSGSISSLSGYGTDYSTSDGSVGFDSLPDTAVPKRD